MIRKELKNKIYTYVKLGFQFHKMIIEHMHDFSMSGFLARNIDTICMELGMFEGLEFLVKWEGYINENNLWELEDNCKNVHNTIAAFYHKYPQAPR